MVRVEQLVSVVSGYSLNYFHWMTELLPGLIRLHPLILADPNVRQLNIRNAKIAMGKLMEWCVAGASADPRRCKVVTGGSCGTVGYSRGTAPLRRRLFGLQGASTVHVVRRQSVVTSAT